MLFYKLSFALQHYHDVLLQRFYLAARVLILNLRSWFFLCSRALAISFAAATLLLLKLLFHRLRATALVPAISYKRLKKRSWLVLEPLSSYFFQLISLFLLKCPELHRLLRLNLMWYLLALCAFHWIFF